MVKVKKMHSDSGRIQPQTSMSFFFNYMYEIIKNGCVGFYLGSNFYFLANCVFQIIQVKMIKDL